MMTLVAHRVVIVAKQTFEKLNLKKKNWISSLLINCSLLTCFHCCSSSAQHEAWCLIITTYFHSLSTCISCQVNTGSDVTSARARSEEQCHFSCLTLGTTKSVTNIKPRSSSVPGRLWRRIYRLDNCWPPLTSWRLPLACSTESTRRSS